MICRKGFKTFNFLFLWLCIKELNYLLFKRGLRLFKGLCLLCLPNVPRAMFIQGGTFIPDSRVLDQNDLDNPSHFRPIEIQGIRVPWTTASSNNFSLFKLLQTILGMYGFHSENDFCRNCNFEPFCYFLKVCY